jgi:hypothetical protein
MLMIQGLWEKLYVALMGVLEELAASIFRVVQGHFLEFTEGYSFRAFPSFAII